MVWWYMVGYDVFFIGGFEVVMLLLYNTNKLLYNKQNVIKQQQNVIQQQQTRKVADTMPSISVVKVTKCT